jgi:hypothetical protein
MLKIKNILIILLLLNSYQAASDDNWQQNKLGMKYKIEGLSESELQTSKKAVELWQKQTAKLFATLNELNVDYSDFSYQQLPFEKIVYGLIYSYDIKSSNAKGVPIVAVSPGSMMSKIGIQNGDIIAKINHINLSDTMGTEANGQWLAATRLTEQLKSLKDGDSLSINIVRNNQAHVLTGNVISSKIPYFTLSIGDSEDEVSNCSYLRTLPNPKPFDNLYTAEILSINGSRFNNRSRIKLLPGTHEIEVKEHIQSKKLSNNIQAKYRKKTHTINVVEGRQLTVSAYLNKELARDKDNYWSVNITDIEKHCFKD